ncbi:MAG: GntR family transcriptional regulator, N-acetylglucosamine utilization regulator [Mycobacterium sp.]|nr:GntR family transcriptional regulator, N-acetylglucosamine utilization regulator [Mycobacterium sp.]
MPGTQPRRPEQIQQFFERVGQLDRRSPVPLYYQLQELLKRDIDAEHWRPGEVLPSESELESHLDVSRTVIRKALDVLEADGQVIRQRGRGTVVAQPKLQYNAVNTVQEWRNEDLSRRAVLSEVIDVRLINAGNNLAHFLQVPSSEQLFEVTAVVSVGHPVSLTQAYVRCDASPELTKAAVSGSAPPLEVGGPDLLHQLATRWGLAIYRSEMSVEATTANEFECQSLQLRKGATTFLVSSLVQDIENEPIAFLRTVVRSDHFAFKATVLIEAGSNRSEPSPKDASHSSNARRPRLVAGNYRSPRS